MKQITRLVIQQQDKTRVNVYLDEAFAFGLALDEAMHLKVGDQLSEADIARLRNDDDYHRAYARALDQLSRRPRSTGEIRRYLQGKKVAEEHIERVITRLTNNALLDDLVFARYWIENRDAFRPSGAQALAFELRQKGLSTTIIDQALAGTDFDEEDNAYRAGLKVLRRYAALEWRDFQQKLGAYLGRRGFRWEVTSRVLRRLWDEREQTDYLP